MFVLQGTDHGRRTTDDSAVSQSDQVADGGGAGEVQAEVSVSVLRGGVVFVGS